MGMQNTTTWVALKNSETICFKGFCKVLTIASEPCSSKDVGKRMSRTESPVSFTIVQNLELQWR